MRRSCLAQSGKSRTGNCMGAARVSAILMLSKTFCETCIFRQCRDHEFVIGAIVGWASNGKTVQAIELKNKNIRARIFDPADRATELCTGNASKLLRFVQRGRILLRCGSAFALSLPSLGVSSLDLGRLFTQAALFSCLRHSAAAWNGPRSPSGSSASVSASVTKSSVICANRGPRSRRRSSM